MSNFETEIMSIDAGQRCIQTSPGEWNLPVGDCYLGVGRNPVFGWDILEQLPPKIKGLNLYLGSDCEILVKALVASSYTEDLERLSVGDCSFGNGSGRDYKKITEMLATVDFPNLKKFELGVWELFDNSHCLYGKIGNVTELLKRMPGLQQLSLFGAFEFTEPLSFPNLTDLTVTLDDYTTNVNGGVISQDSLNNLLESEYPSLREAFIDLECDSNDQAYTFPSIAIEGGNMPKLEKIEFTGGFQEGEIDKLKASDFYRARGIKVFYEEP